MIRLIHKIYMTHGHFPEFLVSQKKSSHFDQYLHFLVQNVHEQGVKKSETPPSIVRQRAQFCARASWTQLGVTTKNLSMSVSVS